MVLVFSVLECKHGDPHRSVFGPSLFIIYKDLHCEVIDDISKFADDSETGRLLRSDKDTMVLPEEMNSLNELSKKLMMHLNINICKVLTIEKNTT